jgi:hypothetical protein
MVAGDFSTDLFHSKVKLGAYTGVDFRLRYRLDAQVFCDPVAGSGSENLHFDFLRPLTVISVQRCVVSGRLASAESHFASCCIRDRRAIEKLLDVDQSHACFMVTFLSEDC